MAKGSNEGAGSKNITRSMKRTEDVLAQPSQSDSKTAVAVRDTQVAYSLYASGKNANSGGQRSGHTADNNTGRVSGGGGWSWRRTETWSQRQNEERLRWAKRQGFTMEDAILRYGLIDFPGLGDRFPSPEPPARNPVRVKLWENFLGQLEGLEIVPSLWNGLPDAARRWLKDSSMETSRVLNALARMCFKQYLLTFIPVHMMHTLVLMSEGNKEYLMGAQKHGGIDEDTVRQCLGFALGDMEDVKYSIHRAMSDAGHFPLHCQQGLEGPFDKCSARRIPFIFRYIFGAHEGFKEQVDSELRGKYGRYKELHFQFVIRPLPDGWDKGDGDLGENGRAAKKQRTDDGGLIQFS